MKTDMPIVTTLAIKIDIAILTILAFKTVIHGYCNRSSY